MELGFERKMFFDTVSLELNWLSLLFTQENLKTKYLKLVQ